MSLFNFQFGDFESSSPDWFSWLSLLSSLAVTILSIWFAYYLGERTYTRDKEDKTSEEAKNIRAENELFTIHLNELQTNISIQISFLTEYQREKKSLLQINTLLNISFLNFIHIRSLYSKKQVSETENLNKLLASLYSIETFLESLRSEFNNYITKYNIFEEKFKNAYRQILYTKYYGYTNVRAIIYRVKNEGKDLTLFGQDDEFMEEYSKLRNVIIKDNFGTANHNKIHQDFILPIIHLTIKSIPNDSDAIEVNDLANESHSAFLDMQNLNNAHFRTIQSFLETLEDLDTKIKEFLSND